MITCPNCGELLGNTVNECFKCHYNFTFKKVMVAEDRTAQRNREAEEQKRKEDEIKQKEIEKQNQLSKNPLFEYKSIVVNDLSSGEIDEIKIQNTLNEWAEKGWRLHSAFSSEIGKNSIGVSIAGFGSITNATINQTVLIFERCIKS